MTMAASHFQEASAHVELQGTSSDDAVECGKQDVRRFDSACSTVASLPEGQFDSADSDNSDTEGRVRSSSFDSDSEGNDTSSSKALEPSMLVVATGRVGSIVLHDPSDEEMCYKLRFADGLQPEADWFARTAVAGPVGTTPTLAAPSPPEPHAQPRPARRTVKSDNRSMDESGELQKLPDKRSGMFHCPHCSNKFETAEALYEHDNCMNMPSEVADAARSGNGTIASVGMKLSGKVPCLHCNQKFDTEQALRMHCKFIHDRVSGMNEGYALTYDFNDSKRIDA
jgi:hypothetical protein